jgi:hypothetical protein
MPSKSFKRKNTKGKNKKAMKTMKTMKTKKAIKAMKAMKTKKAMKKRHSKRNTYGRKMRTSIRKMKGAGYSEEELEGFKDANIKITLFSDVILSEDRKITTGEKIIGIIMEAYNSDHFGGRSLNDSDVIYKIRITKNKFIDSIFICLHSSNPKNNKEYENITSMPIINEISFIYPEEDNDKIVQKKFPTYNNNFNNLNLNIFE